MHPYILRLPFFMDVSGMVFDRSSEVGPVIEEACDSGVVLCEDLDEF